QRRAGAGVRRSARQRRSWRSTGYSGLLLRTTVDESRPAQRHARHYRLVHAVDRPARTVSTDRAWGQFHGAETVGDVHLRARSIAQRWWIVCVALTVLSTVATFWLRPALLGNFGARPWGVIFPVVAIAGMVGVCLLSRSERDGLMLAASGAYLLGMLALTAFVVSPNALPA